MKVTWSVQLFTTSWNSPGQNTGVGSLSLLLGIFPTQGSNQDLLHYRQILYQLSHKGSPRILEWVAFPFSRASSQPRDWTQVSRIAGRFFTSWATREGPVSLQSHNHIHLHVGLLYPRVLPLQIQPIYIKNIFKNPKKLQKGKLKLGARSTIYHLHCIRNYKKFWDGLKCNHPSASLRGWF